MAAARACRACGLEQRVGARFCDGCGAPTGANPDLAEYKQVTVLFADVVRSMDIATRVGPERLREIMSDLLNRSAHVVEHNGGTLNMYTGDGIMALFGAPAALEDHALRACLAALDIHRRAEQLAAEIARRDGLAFQLRIGINSGQVIAGAIGSGPASYTAVGDQVGMAQRMESVAPPGGVMLSQATARLVEGIAVLGDPELVRIKGADQPVPARLLLAVPPHRGRTIGPESTLIGREREMESLTRVVNESIHGTGRVVRVAGSAGIGKSRLIGEITTIAADRGAEVFSAYCQSHTGDIPFHAISGLLRAVFAVDDLDTATARERLRVRLPEADADDLLLLDDLLGIRDAAEAVPVVDPDARRRRLARLVNAAVAANTIPAVYVIEDAHWIDAVSEAMLVDFAAEIPRTSALVLITYRPEYRGALSRIADSESLYLEPLDDSQSSTLADTLLGGHSSTAGVAAQITERAAGNPFFAKEIVRDLVERGILDGRRGAYVCRRDAAEVNVPATVQATIAARIDRLGAGAKGTLNAAAVIGSRFNADLLTDVHGDAEIPDLVAAELIEDVDSAHGDYAFSHPLIRSVAYESQLRSERGQLHRRLAVAIERRDPSAAEQNAALIATHLEAAGDYRAAFGYHMRAAGWLRGRDIGAAWASWRRARLAADRLPADEPDRIALGIAPRTLLCATVWLAGGSVADTGFDELRELCAAVGDQTSLATGMAGMVMALAGHNRHAEALELVPELIALVEDIDNPTLSAGLLASAVYIKSQVGQMTEALSLAQRVIDMTDGHATKGKLIVGSPLAWAPMMRGMSRLCLGIAGWRSDADRAVAAGADLDRSSYVSAVMYKYIVAVPIGALPVDTVALEETAEALRVAEQAGDNHTLALAQLVRGVVLVHQDGLHREEGFKLLRQARALALAKGFTLNALAIVDPEIARARARSGDLDGAIELSRAAIEDMFARGAMFLRGVATTVLVEALLARGADDDLHEAQAAIDRLAAVPTDPGFVLHEIPLLRLRALLARAHGDEVACTEFIGRYRARASAAGFDPLLAESFNLPGQ